MTTTLRCVLCPKECRIAPGESGECRIRVNIDGELKVVVYGYPVAAHLDPIEKKPLFHFFPGSKILSVATVGCNLHCKNCQNWEISQANPEDTDAYFLPPKDLIKTAWRSKSSSIAYTYSEPLAYYEYTLDSAKLGKREGLKNVLVTAGYLQKKPLKKLFSFIDAANVDLKALSDKFYRDICDGSLAPVLDGLCLAKEMGLHLEITNLIIPTLNDSKKMISDLCKWIFKNLGPNTPLHFSRFHPQYKMVNLPPTSSETLEMARTEAQDVGLNFVYIGNLYSSEGENTYCPNCHRLLIRRRGYIVLEYLLEKGKCPKCKQRVQGVWKDEAL